MNSSLMKRMKDFELAVENAPLKKMYAEEHMKVEIRKKALEGKLYGHLGEARGCPKYGLLMR